MKGDVCKSCVTELSAKDSCVKGMWVNMDKVTTRRGGEEGGALHD